MERTASRWHPLSLSFKAPNFIQRYGFAIFVSGIAFILTYWLKPLVNNNLFDLFQAAVVLSAFYAGLGPALVSAAISIVFLDYFFIPPLNTFSMGLADLLRLSIFGALAVLTSSLSARLKDAKSGLEEAHQELELRVEERTEQLSRVNAELEAEISHRLAAEKEILQISSREQRRLGEDLHDGVCQILAGVRLLSEDLRKELTAQSRPEAREMEKIETRLSEALAQTDVISRGLYPVELETNGLMAALQELADKISKIYPVRCYFICRQPVLIQDSTAATHLYRIAQEAVTNAIKSGKAKIIRLRLSVHPRRILLLVTDNGIGYQNPPARRGMGLKIMAYRASMINGSLRIRSRIGGGTLVRCVFPTGDTRREVLREA